MNWVRIVLVITVVIGGLCWEAGLPANAAPKAHCILEWTSGVQWWDCK